MPARCAEAGAPVCTWGNTEACQPSSPDPGSATSRPSTRCSTHWRIPRQRWTAARTEFHSELQALTNAEIDIDLRNLITILSSRERLHRGDVDFPVPIPGSARIIGEKRWPGLSAGNRRRPDRAAQQPQTTAQQADRPQRTYQMITRCSGGRYIFVAGLDVESSGRTRVDSPRYRAHDPPRSNVDRT